MSTRATSSVTLLPVAYAITFVGFLEAIAHPSAPWDRW